jgi:HSP20 family protein
LLSYGGADYAPRFDVKETKDGYVIKADLPGVKDNDLAISLTGNQLTISGQRDTEQSEDGERYYAAERSHGSFARTFSLPDGIDSEHVTAALKDGVLVVHIPKRPETQPKKIAIGAGDSKTKS